MGFEGLYNRFIGTGSASTATGKPGDAGGGASIEHKRVTVGQFLIVSVQLGLLLLVIRQFQIESNAFLRIVLLTFLGFVVHCFLPLRYRLPFFVVLSLAGVALIFGPLSGAWLIGLGLLLIGICHLPVAFAVRAGLLLLIGAFLAVLRVEWLHAPWSQAIWPILASMFMFRLIVYLYDLKHDTAPVSVPRTLAYFFLLPNVCFPLFPVVDYKTFRRNYFSGDPYRIYQVGVDWMTRGVIHLILYRLIYYEVTMAPSDVTSPSDLVRYLVSNFLLYLRISGQFHLIVGMLHLFGFNLPETHHRYYLASSFSDFWRRINIYWKDFMLKLFYYPAYFKLRRWGNTQAMVLSTLIVFVSTWLLHSYQWFWLRGTFPLTIQDICFWGILAGLVVGNSLYEARHAGGKALGKTVRTFRGSAVLALRTAATFSVICILWSLWTSESLSAWLSLWTPVRQVANVDFKSITPLLMVAAVLGGATRLAKGKIGEQSSGGTRWKAAVLGSAPAKPIASLVLVLLIGSPAVYTRLGPSTATLIHSLRAGGLSRLDTARLQRGYYEELLGVDRFNSQLWEVYAKRPLDWLDGQGTGLARPTGDFLQRELVPSATSFTSRVTMHTNRWGMRNRECEKQPAPNTYRIAVLGASPVMGMGVEDNETFESLLEERLNRQHAGERYAKYEVLNFGVSNYKPLQQLVVLQKVFSFTPNAVLYVATGHDDGQAARYLAEVVRNRVDIPYEYLREIARRAELDPEMTETEALRHLKPLRGELLSWLYHQIVDACRERGVRPLWVHLSMPDKTELEDHSDYNTRDAEEAGFVILNLDDVYANHDLASLQLAEWDNHPNAAAHRLIAQRLYEELRAKDATGALQLVARPESPGHVDDPNSMNTGSRKDGHGGD